MHVDLVKRKPITDVDIYSLIPQRPPMVMVSGLLAADKQSITTSFLIEEDNIFVNDGLFRESGLIENIAQSAAAMNGYHAFLQGEPVRNGYIGGIKNLEVSHLPIPGQGLTTVVTETYHVMDTSIVVGEVSLDGKCIARCEMKVFMQP